MIAKKWGVSCSNLTITALLLVCGYPVFANPDYYTRTDNSSDKETVRSLTIGDDVRSVTVNTESYSISDDSISYPEVIILKSQSDSDEDAISFINDENAAPEDAKESLIDFAIINEEGEVLAIGHNGFDFQFRAFKDLGTFRSEYFYERAVFYEIENESDQMKMGEEFNLSGGFLAEYDTSASTCDINNNNAQFVQVPAACNNEQDINAQENQFFSAVVNGLDYQVYPDYVRGQIVNCGVNEVISNGNPYDFKFAYDAYVLVSDCESQSINRDSLNHNSAIAGLYGVTSVRVSGLGLGDDIGEITVDMDGTDQSSWSQKVISTQFDNNYSGQSSTGDLNARPADIRFETSGNATATVSIEGQLTDQRGYDSLTPSSFYRGSALDDNVLCFEVSSNNQRQAIVGNLVDPRNDSLYFGNGFGLAYSNFCRVLIDHEKSLTNERLFYFPKLGSAISIAIDSAQNISGWMPSIITTFGIAHDEYVTSRASYTSIMASKIQGYKLTSTNFIAGVINVYEK